jgi:putative inorganic carbon (HCO3(-)) transporter
VSHKIERTQQSNKDKTVIKNNRLFYSFIVIAVVILAWIINKDISIPSWLTISFGVFVTFILFFKGIKNPEIPFYVLAAYLPFNKILSGTFGGFMTALNLTNILILITFFCWVVNRGVGGNGTKDRAENKVRSGFHWLVFLFCFLGIFSVMRGGFYYGSRYLMEFIIPLKRWLTPVFLYFITLVIVKDKEILKKTVVIIMIVVAIAGLLAVKEGFDIGDSGSLDSSRVGGLAQQPNMMGAFFVYYMFLFFGFFLLNWKKIKSWGLLIPFLICFRGIQVTFSRGALLAFTFGMIAITFFKNKIIFVVMCFGILFALFNPQWLPGSMRYAIQRTSGGEQMYDNVPFEDTLDRSSATRIEIWKGALQMIKDNPWWGVGYGVFPYAIPMYVPSVGEIDAHNTYIIIAAEMGIFVLFVFLLIIFVLFKNTLWLYRRIEDKFIKAVALGMLGGIAGMLVANMFGSRLESEEVSAYFWILAGLIIRAVIMKKRKEIT